MKNNAIGTIKTEDSKDFASISSGSVGQSTGSAGAGGSENDPT
jgi:hypothetical protein